MSGKASRDKGARFEREVVNGFKFFGLDARRTAYSGAMDWEKGDIRVTPSYPGAERALSGECKRRASLPVIFNELGEHDFLAVKEDRGQILIVLRFKDFAELLQ